MTVPPSDPVILVDRLTVRYGDQVALKDVSLQVERGCVYALLGRNGAGKSSLVRCLLGQRRPDGGRAALLGHDAWSGRTRAMARTGVVPEEPDGSPAQTVGHLAAFCASLYRNWNGPAVDERLGRHEIPLNRPFGRLSKGQQKLVSLALALGHEPELLVLDDPTLGLDVAVRRALYDEIVGELADRGTTVLLTTHDLAAAEGIADRVGILVDGRLLVDEPLEALKRRHRETPALEEIFLALTERRSEVA